MLQYKFRIHGEILIDGEETPMIISPEHIKTMTRISNYLEKNMPMILLHLNLDKNLFDKVLQNAKTETVHLIVEKFNALEEDKNPIMEPYIDDEFSVIVSNDINYNKELDYPEIDGVSDEKPREDIYRELNIGLVSKTSLEANKVVSNGIVHESNIMDLVAYYLKDTHLLIKPFDYNNKIDQLTIPPMDTLVKTVEYLNSFKVFYRHKYLFFIDEPYCTYLIPRSGEPVQKKDEEYTDVMIDIRKVTDPGMITQGMEKDDQNKCYSIIIPSVNTKFTIDHDAAKMANEFQVIINPNKDNDIASNQDMMNIQSLIEGEVSKFQSNLRGYISKQVDAGGKLTAISDKISGFCKYDLTNLKSVQQDLTKRITNGLFPGIDASQSVPWGTSTITVTLLQSAMKSAAESGFNSVASSLNNNINTAGTFANNVVNFTKKLNEVNKMILNLDNLVGSVGYVLAKDTLGPTLSKINSLAADIDTVLSLYSSVKSAVSMTSGITSTASSMDSTANTLTTCVNASQGSTGYSNVDSGMQEKMDKVKSNNGNLNYTCNELRQVASNINSTFNQYEPYINTLRSFSTIINSFSNAIGKMNNFDVKSKFDSRVLSDISSKGFSLANSLKKISAGSLSFNDVVNITENLSSVFNIDGIGKLGLSNFRSKINFSGDPEIDKLMNTGCILIKTKNDNFNETKNIISEVENMINQLTVDKIHLDPSVLTPNKKYIVKNYDNHSEKDGSFLLNKKTEMYRREGEFFYCKTILDLSKVVS